jgi:ribonuclease HII
MRKYFFIVGIDEAGRGPLAGPVCVGAVGTMGLTVASKLVIPGW